MFIYERVHKPKLTCIRICPAFVKSPRWSACGALSAVVCPQWSARSGLPAVLCPKLGDVIMSLAPLVQASVDWDDLQRQQVFSVHSMLQAENMSTLP